MSLDYEKKKAQVLKEMIENYKRELLEGRDAALDMPVETDNGFNIERETLITDIDEKLEILKRHEKDPYFAKLIFIDQDDGEEFQGYLGRLSIGDIGKPNDEKIVDWRAPIADLYYNGSIGTSSYNALGKEYNVDLKLKRQIQFKDGQVNSIYDFQDKVSSDEFLTPFLTQSANNRLKSIVSTIQEEQNKIIRMPIHQSSIVQGVAGSGKTTVALHRLSYLMYNYKRSALPEEYLIISPNEIFVSYISSILIDLDADKANSQSINKFFESICSNEYRILNKHTQYESLQKRNIDTSYLSEKTSLKFAQEIDKFIEKINQKIFYKDLILKGVKVLDKDDFIRFFDNPNNLDTNTLSINGCKKLSLTLATSQTLKSKAFHNINIGTDNITKKYQIQNLVESGNFGYIKNCFKTNFKLFSLYKDFITQLDDNYKILKKETLANLKNKVISYDDLGSILYLQSRIENIPYLEKLKCVFIDEAQDISALLFLALRKLFKNAKFSIYGDIAQGIYGYQSISNWEEVKSIIGDSEILYLSKSYRTSIEITEEANKTLEKLGTPPASNVLRHGEKVERYQDAKLDTFKTQLETLNKNYSNTAIIVKDSTELKLAEEYLKTLNLTVLDESNILYGKAQNTILTVQTAKGLEFDSVIIFNEDSYSDSVIDLRLLYVAKTRALHKLIINSVAKNKIA
ncbi:MAG: ATP-binding domain-containing protein [Clostridia bacterium]|nr:ATP-binding domain-containing protein [Clostridia bacterium]